MKNMIKNLFRPWVVATLAIALAAPFLIQAPVSAQFQPVTYKKVAVSDNITAVSTDVGMWVKYVGSWTASATVAVDAATGDLTFISNGAAHTGFECPVSGDLGGVIDVSDAACNTMGEVIDIINSDTTGSFKAVLGGSLRTDTSVNTLITLAATDLVERPEGVGLLLDTVVALHVNTVLLPRPSEGIKNWLNKKKLVANPFEDTDTVLMYASENITSSGTVGNFTAYCVTEAYKDGGNSSETVRVMYLETGAATTATGKIDEFNYADGGLRCNGGKVIVRIASGTDLTAPLVLASGYQMPRNF